VEQRTELKVNIDDNDKNTHQSVSTIACMRYSQPTTSTHTNLATRNSDGWVDSDGCLGWPLDEPWLTFAFAFALTAQVPLVRSTMASYNAVQTFGKKKVRSLSIFSSFYH
jgi:hypothetical protein